MLKKLLSTPTAQLGRASRLVVFQIKLWTHCARLLRKNRAGQQAAALSYHTIFGLVPLAIVMLMIFQSFPAFSDIGQKVKGLVYEELHLDIEYPNPDPNASQRTIVLTEQLDDIVGGFFTGLNKGSVTIISTVIVIWAALALLSTIERAFNNIWHVARGRNFLHRMINYWALLTLGPLLIGAGIYITTQYSTFGRIHKTILSNITPALLSYLVSATAFFMLYFVLPNTKVQVKAAVWGALVAALVWAFAKWGFGLCVVEFVPYGKVYGVLGLIPLTVLWIYITWLIVMFGLQLTFTTQHLKSLDAAEIAAAKRTEECFIANDLTAINIVREIADAFEKNNAPIQAEVVCTKLGIPAEFGNKVLDHLVGSGLIAKTSEPKLGFVPAQDPENIRLSDIVDAVAAVSFAQKHTLNKITQSQRAAFRSYNLKQILADTQGPITDTSENQ